MSDNAVIAFESDDDYIRCRAPSRRSMTIILDVSPDEFSRPGTQPSPGRVRSKSAAMRWR